MWRYQRQLYFGGVFKRDWSKRVDANMPARGHKLQFGAGQWFPQLQRDPHRQRGWPQHHFFAHGAFGTDSRAEHVERELRAAQRPQALHVCLGSHHRRQRGAVHTARRGVWHQPRHHADCVCLRREQVLGARFPQRGRVPPPEPRDQLQHHPLLGRLELRRHHGAEQRRWRHRRVLRHQLRSDHLSHFSLLQSAVPLGGRRQTMHNRR